MPKVKYIPVPPRKQLHDLFSHYCRQRKITSTDLAPGMDTTPEALRKQMNRPDKAWRIDEIQSFCKALDVSVTLTVTKGTVTIAE